MRAGGGLVGATARQESEIAIYVGTQSQSREHCLLLSTGTSLRKLGCDAARDRGLKVS